MGVVHEETTAKNVIRVTPSVAAPGDTNSSDATGWDVK